MFKESIIVCSCLAQKENCEWCENMGYLSVELKAVTPKESDYRICRSKTVPFDPIPGQYTHFYVRDHLIGAANIDFKNVYAYTYVNRMVPFIGSAKAIEIMIDALKYLKDSMEIRGQVDNESMNYWRCNGAVSDLVDAEEENMFSFIWHKNIESDRHLHFRQEVYCIHYYLRRAKHVDDVASIEELMEELRKVEDMWLESLPNMEVMS